SSAASDVYKRQLIELSLNRTPEEIEEIQRALFKSRLREGYGRYVLGMIAYRLGNRARAVKHLRAFLHRNSKISRAKEITLKEELECARSILSEVEGVS
ncbi:MAG: hypothetical protein N2515_02855, partial [Deltaproteobacteria bacterium]|nr:hypothetical protein [Deltaproteobacteria bacterium]